MPNRLSKVVKKAAPGKKQKPVPVKIVSEPGMPKPDDSWRARDALSTLQRAAEIQRDKPLMRAAKAEAKKMMKQLSSVCK